MDSDSGEVYHIIDRFLRSSIFHSAHFSQSPEWQKKVFFFSLKWKVFNMPFRAHKLFHDKTLNHCPINLSERRYTCSKWTSFFEGMPCDVPNNVM